MRHWIHIGTQKAASSFLRGLLAQVPEVGLADRQELDFFVDAGERSLQAYRGHFPKQKEILFENSPVYFREGAKAAPAIAATFAEPPMLSLFLRDPVEALISHHEMRIRQGFFERQNVFSGNPNDLPAFVRTNPHYVADWRYMEVLQQHWLPRFPRDCFAIHTFEAFTARPVESLEDLLRQAGFAGRLRVDTEVWKNPRPSSPLAKWLLKATKQSRALRHLRQRAMKVRPLRRISERALFASAGGKKQTRVPSHVKQELAELFREDVERLCAFLGREILPWPNFYPVEPTTGAPSVRTAMGNPVETVPAR